MQSLQKLIQLMEIMIAAHARLFDLAKEKRTSLVEGDLTALQTITYRESTCTNEIEKFEEARKNLVADYMMSAGHSGMTFTLEEVLRVQGDVHDMVALNQKAKQLRDIIREINALNETNQQLIQASLSYIQYSVGMFVQNEPSIGYGPKTGNRYSSLLDAKI